MLKKLSVRQPTTGFGTMSCHFSLQLLGKTTMRQAQVVPSAAAHPESMQGSPHPPPYLQLLQAPPKHHASHLESPSHLEVLEVDLHVGLVRGATAAGCQLHIGLRQLRSNGNVCSTHLHWCLAATFAPQAPSPRNLPFFSHNTTETGNSLNSRQ